MEQLLDIDRRLLLFLNGLHNPLFDSIMWIVSGTYIWIPFYVLLLYLLIRKYGKDSIWLLVGVAITILICDQVTTGFMKPYFARFRPSHEPSLDGLLHLVNGYRGGLYGFASSHAANAFGVTIFIWLALKSYYRWIGLIFIGSTLVSYSRIYLGVHYPSDILVGALIGVFTGCIIFLLQQFLVHKKKSISVN